jgi:GAF domain-containing protein
MLSQFKELIQKTEDPEARASTLIALLHHKLTYYFWTGFYFIRKGELTVGSYQGPIACLVLEKNTGVCWKAINENRTIIIDDVKNYPDHITCDSRSRSEIVIPIVDEHNIVFGVLDIDSKELRAFDKVDAEYLDQLLKMIEFKA